MSDRHVVDYKPEFRAVDYIVLDRNSVWYRGNIGMRIATCSMEQRLTHYIYTGIYIHLLLKGRNALTKDVVNSIENPCICG